jgi:uncharacterized protein (DUF2062 family)
MIHLTKSLVRRWLDTLLHVHDTPERTAAAFAVGVFIGFSPFLGLHTIMGIAVAFLFNFNRVATLLGVYSNLPWIIGQYYVFTTVLGAALTRTRLPAHYREQLTGLFDTTVWSGAFWHQLARVLEPLLLPYFVGSMIGCAILGAAAYPIALAVVRQRRNLALRAKADSHGSTERSS